MWFWKREILLGSASALLIASAFISGPVMADAPAYPEIIQAIARDIASLKAQFPQLKMFSPSMCCDLKRLAISYSYSVHEPQRRTGWAGGVPHPNENGVWFFIDLHDRDSQAQIHSQPASVPLCIGEKAVSFLILEGAKTKPIGKRIESILRKHGVTSCGTSASERRRRPGP